MNIIFGKKDHYYFELMEGSDKKKLAIYTSREKASIITKIVIKSSKHNRFFKKVLDLNKLDNFLVQDLYYRETNNRYDIMIEFEGL